MPESNMKKWQAHLLLLVFDVLSLVYVWTFFGASQEVLNSIQNNTDVIQFSSRIGFWICGFLMPVFHIYCIVIQLKPELGRGGKYQRAVNIATGITLAGFISMGFLFTNVTKSRVERAGYYKCSEARSGGIWGNPLVYTKNASICLEQVEKERLGLIGETSLNN